MTKIREARISGFSRRLYFVEWVSRKFIKESNTNVRAIKVKKKINTFNKNHCSAEKFYTPEKFK